LENEYRERIRKKTDGEKGKEWEDGKERGC
jgi:hypothetical protein